MSRRQRDWNSRDSPYKSFRQEAYNESRGTRSKVYIKESAEHDRDEWRRETTGSSRSSQLLRDSSLTRDHYKQERYEIFDDDDSLEKCRNKERNNKVTYEAEENSKRRHDRNQSGSIRSASKFSDSKWSETSKRSGNNQTEQLDQTAQETIYEQQSMTTVWDTISAPTREIMKQIRRTREIQIPTSNWLLLIAAQNSHSMMEEAHNTSPEKQNIIQGLLSQKLFNDDFTETSLWSQRDAESYEAGKRILCTTYQFSKKGENQSIKVQQNGEQEQTTETTLNMSQLYSYCYNRKLENMLEKYAKMDIELLQMQRDANETYSALLIQDNKQELAVLKQQHTDNIFRMTMGM